MKKEIKQIKKERNRKHKSVNINIYKINKPDIS